MNPPGIPPRSPSERSISPPPAAAPAAGGWGIDDPRLVHSVEFLGCWSAALRRRRCGRCGVLVAELSLSGDGSLRGAVVELSTSPSSWVFGSVELGSPSPATAWRLRRIFELNKEEVRCGFAVKMLGYGVGSLEPATGDFPSAQGVLLIQAIEGSNGGGAPPAASWSSSSLSGSRGSWSWGPACNFILVLDLSV